MELIFPIPLEPGEQRWSRVAAAQTYPAPLTGRTRVKELPFQTWLSTITFQNLQGARRQAVAAFLNRINSPAVPFWLPDFRNLNGGGALDTSSLVTNGYAAGVSGWTAGASTALSESVGWFRPLNTDGLAVNYFEQQLAASVTDANYRLQFNYQQGDEIDSATVQIGTTQGGSDILAPTALIEGRNSIVFQSTATTALWVRFAGTSTQASFFYIGAIDTAPVANYLAHSRPRAIRFDYNLHALFADAFLLAGDFVDIDGEFCQLVVDADTVEGGSGGGGFLFVEPPIRGAPAADAPIAFGRPACRMRIVRSSGITNRPGDVAGPVTIDCAEQFPDP